jgi:hypothetical protein
MKSTKFLVYLVCIIAGSLTLLSQQTHFNVPSSNVTAQGKMHFQANTFLTNSLDRTQVYGMYGVNQDTEVGLNFLNYRSGSNWYGITAQHREVLNADHTVTIGGAYYLNSNNSYYVYGLVTANKLLAKANINAGLFYGNESMFGESTIGLMASIEYQVINDKIHVIAEYMSGKHWMNGLNVGGSYDISKNMKAAIGLNVYKAQTGPSPFILQLHYNM